MAKGKINKTNVDRFACPVGKSMDVLWDDALRGFGVIAYRRVAKPSSCNANEMGALRKSRSVFSVRRRRSKRAPRR